MPNTTFLSRYTHSILSHVLSRCSWAHRLSLSFRTHFFCNSCFCSGFRAQTYSVDMCVRNPFRGEYFLHSFANSFCKLARPGFFAFVPQSWSSPLTDPVHGSSKHHELLTRFFSKVHASPAAPRQLKSVKAISASPALKQTHPAATHPSCSSWF